MSAQTADFLEKGFANVEANLSANIEARRMYDCAPEVPCYIHWWKDRQGWLVYIKEWDAGETGEIRHLVEPILGGADE